MPWPEIITHIFEYIDKSTTDGNQYSGPFNPLLTWLFPASEYYQVAPQGKYIADSNIFIMTYFIGKIISRQLVPISFIQVMPHFAYDSNYLRRVADNQMCERFLDLIARGTPIPEFYGISALGTQFCVYEYIPASHHPTPLGLVPHPHFITNTIPKEKWDLDILEPQGEARLKEVVHHIKEMVVDIHNIVSLLLPP